MISAVYLNLMCVILPKFGGFWHEESCFFCLLVYVSADAFDDSVCLYLSTYMQ